MTVRRVLCAFALAPLVLAGLAAPSGSAPGKAVPTAIDARADSGWAQLNTKGISLLAKSDLLRTSDGVLHVVYPQEVGPLDVEYEHTSVSTTGGVISHSTAVSGWGTLTDDPILLPAAGGGMQIIFGGLQDTNVANPYSAGHTYRAVGDASGASWTVPGEALTKSKTGYASYGTGATLLPDGTSIQGHPLNSEFTWRVGTTPLPTSDATPADSSFSVAGGGLKHFTLVQSGGNVWAAWYDQGTDNGYFARQIHPALGPVLKAPGQTADTLDPGQAVPMVVRPDGSIVMAYCIGYPTCTSVGLWPVGTSTVYKVPGSGGAETITMDTGPTGRLWVAWADGDDVIAARSSTTGFSFGAQRRSAKPDPNLPIFQLRVEASRGEASLVANDGAGIYHRQLQAGLVVKASTKRWDGDQRKTVTFKVTDAAQPVSGAKVLGGGESCKTNAQGKCSITFAERRPGKIKMKAKRSGFSPALVTLTVKP